MTTSHPRQGLLRTLVAGVAILAAAATTTLEGEEMSSYLSETRDLVEAGDYDRALERFLWFHHHALEHEPAMYGVRLSFALGYWKHLGDLHPPALAAMVETRDRSVERLLAGDGDWHLFNDVAALNDVLGQDERTVELFRILHRERPELAAQSWQVAKDAVYDAQAIDLARIYLTAPEQEFEQIETMYRDHETRFGTGPHFGPDFEVFVRERFAADARRLIGIVLAIDRRETAVEIQRRALAVVDHPELRSAIPGHEPGE